MYTSGFNSDEGHDWSKEFKIRMMRDLAENVPELKPYVEEYVRYMEEFDQAFTELAGTGLSEEAIVAEMVAMGFPTCPCGNCSCALGNQFKTERYRNTHNRERPIGIDGLQLDASELEFQLQAHPADHKVVYGLGPDYFVCTKCGVLDNEGKQMREKLQADLKVILDEISCIEEAPLYAWIIARMRDFPSIEEAIAWLKAITVEWHDTTIHGRFVEDLNRPGVCKECDWINPEFVSNPRLEITLRQRALNILKALESPPIIVDLYVVDEPPLQLFNGFSLN